MNGLETAHERLMRKLSIHGIAGLVRYAVRDHLAEV